MALFIMNDEETAVAAPAVVETAPAAATEESAQSSFAPRVPREQRGQFVKRKKVCAFCAEKAEFIDYKDSGKLRKFITEHGHILPRRVTGTCAHHQRVVTTAIKRARHIALLPYKVD